jgi:hypothetical protein
MNEGGGMIDAEAVAAFEKRIAEVDTKDPGLGTVAAVDLLQAKLLPNMSQLQLLLRDRSGGRMYTATIPLVRVEDGDETAIVRRVEG